MRFTCLASGSEGNCILIESMQNNKTERLLIDCGINLVNLEKRLAERSVTLKQIDGVVITHEHGDHCKGVVSVVKKIEIPVFMTYGTFLASSSFKRDLKPSFFSPHKKFNFLGFEIEPFPVPHDARETIAIIIKVGDCCLGVLTDTGMVTKHTLNVLKKVGALVIEFNYDENLLNQSKYPEALKKRISSNYGHLSNTSAFNLIRALESEYQKVIVAAHLSTNNNSESIVNSLLEKLSHESKVSTFIAGQSSGTPWIHVN